MWISRGVRRGPALAVLLVLEGAVVLRAADCNQNGIEDDADIASATSLDCNVNGVPDECDVRPGALAWMDGQDVAIGRLYDITLGNLDGDEDLDLVASDGNGVLVSLNHGDGTFGPAVQYSGSANNPPRVALGDLDGDQDLDIAYARWNSFSVLLNRSDGTFADAVDYGSGMGDARDVAGGDVDGDGDLDLVFAGSTQTVTIRFNQGDGTFPTSTHHGSLPSYNVTTADVSPTSITFPHRRQLHFPIQG